MDIKKEVKAILPNVLEWRDYLHQCPEIGFELEQTVSYVESVLSSLNIESKRVAGGLIADVNCRMQNEATKRVAFRADMDALEIVEETGLPYASTNGCMHACGHDGHISCLLGVAKLVAKHVDELACNVRFIFQPAEELGTGSKTMIEAGVLDGVDEIIGAHLGTIDQTAEPGMVTISLDSVLSCMDRFIIDVKGYGSHGSMPENSIDPVATAAEIVMALQTIVSREITPFEAAVVSVCKFQAGSAFNIIPNDAHLEGTIRAFSNEMRYYLRDRIEAIARSVAEAHKAKIEYQFMLQPPPMVNNHEVAEKVFNISKELYPEHTALMKRPSMVGEDFSNYMEQIPGAFFLVYNPLPIDGNVYPHHNAKFALDDNEFEKSIAIMFKYALEGGK